MLHFVTSYMKQNKSRKQTLESAQYGLEISFKSCIFKKLNFSWKSPYYMVPYHLNLDSCKNTGAKAYIVKK